LKTWRKLTFTMKSLKFKRLPHSTRQLALWGLPCPVENKGQAKETHSCIIPTSRLGLSGFPLLVRRFSTKSIPLTQLQFCWNETLIQQKEVEPNLVCVSVDDNRKHDGREQSKIFLSKKNKEGEEKKINCWTLFYFITKLLSGEEEGRRDKAFKVSTNQYLPD